jgi:DNA-directed RNA polymerase alpha subunit
MLVADLDVGVRARNLSRFEPNCRTVRELVTRSANELLRVPNFGRVSLQETRMALADLGLSLRGDDDLLRPWRSTIPVRLAAIEAKLDAILAKLNA